VARRVGFGILLMGEIEVTLDEDGDEVVGFDDWVVGIDVIILKDAAEVGETMNSL